MNAVDVRQIERDLRDLWQRMAEAHQGEQLQPVTRVCVLNLLVVCPDESSAQATSQILADVTTQHPGRMMVIFPRAEPGEPAIDAWVTAQCHLAAGRRQQVCCEQIMVAAVPPSLGQVPSIVRSLLVPDLTVVLWWRNDLTVDSPLFDELIKASDRVVIDSAAAPNPQAALLKVAGLTRQRPRVATFSDLSWSRLTPWRAAVSAFYDVPEWQEYLGRVARVEIGCRGDRSPALLLASWFATRLGWKLTGQTQKGWKLSAGNRHVAIQFNATTDSIALVVEGDAPARFALVRSENGLHLQTNVTLESTKLIDKITPFPADSEAALLSKELEIQTRDRSYEDAVEFLARLLTA